MDNGRNLIPVPNSDAKCLLENWVEERETRPYDEYKDRKKFGHKAILTVNERDKMSKDTIHTVSYQQPIIEKQETVGARRKLLAQFYLEKYGKEYIEKDPRDEEEPLKTDFTTETKAHFSPNFTKTIPQESKPHNYFKEAPVTFWSEHKLNIHGISQVKTGDTPFRKNAKFSTPIGEYWNETLPYEYENYPKM